MRRALSMGLLVLAAAASCAKSDADSVVLVNVDVVAGTSGITQLRAAIALGTLSTSEDFPATNGADRLDFPTSFSLTVPRERQGAIAVTVTGVNAAGATVAVGSDQKDLVVGGQTTLAILLAPPVVDKKDAATGPEGGRDAGADVADKRDAAGTGGSVATGGATGGGGVVAIDGRPGSGGAGGGTWRDAAVSTGGSTAIDAGRDAAVDSSSVLDGGAAIDAGSTTRTLFDFASSAQGWLFNSYQGVAGGVPSKPINVAVTPVTGLSSPSLLWDGTVGQPAGSLEVNVSFNDYDQYVAPSVNFATPQDWSNQEVTVRAKLDPVKAASFTTGGLLLFASDENWALFSRWYNLPADGEWHTYALDLNGSTGIRTDRIVQLSVQVGSGGVPAGAAVPAFVPTSLTVYLDDIELAPIPNKVTIVDGQGQGAMTGYGWVAVGELDTLTSPTCGGVAITTATPCVTGTTWSKANALCVTGSIPALPVSPTDPDYDANWGIAVGVNAGPPGYPIGRSFRSITFDMTGTPLVGLRAKVHRKGDADTLDYCANLTAAVPISVTAFNTSCWDGTGIVLTADDVPLIDMVSVQIVSGSAAVTVTDLCLAGITFGE